MRLISTAIIVCSVLCLFSNIAYPKNYVCGVALGFPPYQFQRHGQPKGFDIDVIKVIAKRRGMNLIFLQDDWDLVVNKLRFGEIDFIAGMEVNEIRKRLFDFTPPYYHRYDVVFIKEDDMDTKTIEDLYNQIITGDRHSFIERDWQKKGINNKIRIMQTDNKRESMKLLRSGKTKAAIMPEAVGKYLAKQMGFKIKILVNPDPGSPVAIAVKKGNQDVLNELDTALQDLMKDDEIKALHNKWF